MELIINILILLVIFFTIMKRFNEMTTKGKELTEAPPYERPPYAEPSVPEEYETGYEEPHVYPEEEPSRPPWMRALERAGVRIPKDKTYQEMIKAAPAVSRKPEQEKEIPGKTVDEVFAELGKNEVVRGIILSEILGPPVSLRD